jgi:hypothetical protein
MPIFSGRFYGKMGLVPFQANEMEIERKSNIPQTLGP